MGGGGAALMAGIDIAGGGGEVYRQQIKLSVRGA